MFSRLVKGWEGSQGMSLKRAQKAFDKLSIEEQDAALAMRDRWFEFLRSQKKSNFPAPLTYIDEKLWQFVPNGFGERMARQSAGEARPFGKFWSAARFGDLMLEPYGNIPAISQIEEQLIENGTCNREQLLRDKRAKEGWPRVNRMHERAITRHAGVQADVALEPVVQWFAAVQRGSESWVAWRELHLDRGWPWFGEDRDCPEWVWMPAPPEAPETYSSPIEAVRAAIARFETEHAAITERQAAE